MKRYLYILIILFNCVILHDEFFAQVFEFQIGTTSTPSTSDGELDSPSGVAFFPDGKILVIDKNNERIQIFSSTGNFIRKFGSSGSGDGQFFSNAAEDAAITSDGDIWIVDRGNDRLQKFDSTGNFLAKFGTLGSGDGNFDDPYGVTILETTGKIYVADRRNERVQYFDKDGNFLGKFGSLGSDTSQFASNGGASDLAFDLDYNLWVADRANHRVQKFDSNGVFILEIGSEGAGDGQFDNPEGVAVSPTGDIYVCDRNNERVSIWNSSGVYKSTFGSVGTGEIQFASNGGVVDMAFDGGTKMAIVDRNNDRVQILSDAALPVELISFTALIKKNLIELKWDTATEINNYGFNIERRPETADWTNIGFVLGHGNSNSPKSYSFKDEEMTAGKVYYRLKQIDYDGSYEYSNMVEVSLLESLPSHFVLNQNYPNPFNPATIISYRLSSESQAKLEIFDSIGRLVSTLVDEKQFAGSYSYNFNAEGLPSGTYTYRLTTNGFSETKKMILLK